MEKGLENCVVLLKTECHVYVLRYQVHARTHHFKTDLIFTYTGYSCGFVFTGLFSYSEQVYFPPNELENHYLDSADIFIRTPFST